MNCRRNNIPVMRSGPQAITAILMVFAQLLVLISAEASNGSNRKWQTLDGGPPFVVAHGGFSGIFPSSSLIAYNLALMTSVSDVILWCDVQLTKDGAGVCFPNFQMQNSSDIEDIFPGRGNKYDVDGVQVSGYFSLDFTLKELKNVTLRQGIFTRVPSFDGSMFQILTVEEVFQQTKPPGFWLNVQHPAFYSQHNMSMRNFLLGASKSIIVSHISAPDLSFLRGIASRFAATREKLIFRFLSPYETEPSTNQTYASLLKNLTLIKTFASGILVPKTYIWPIDNTLYLEPHSSLVTDAHRIGLEVYAAGFANDNVLSYNYSYNPVSEYLNFVDNGDFSVDGVLSDFPVTPSEAFDCFAHLGKNAHGQATPLVISLNGASGDYPSCTDLAYNKAISDGADIIDCPVQMSKDGVPFCLPVANLMNSTTIAQTMYVNRTAKIPEVQPNNGIFSFSLTWSEIQGLTPQISNPRIENLMYRNPAFRNAGKLVSLSDFLGLSKNSTSLSGVLIIIENAAYLAEKQGLSITDAVTQALKKAGYTNKTTQKVMIQSTNSSVLKKFIGGSYDLIYEVDETIRDARNSTIAEIKSFASSVLVAKESVYDVNDGFMIAARNVVPRLHAFNLSVYAKTFSNEFVSVPYDLFADPIAEINTYVVDAEIDGVVTDFPQTAVSYRKNRCLKRKETPNYMPPVKGGDLIQLMAPQYLPPAEAPAMVLSDSEVSEPPLPEAIKLAPPPQSQAQAPEIAKKNGQSQEVTASAVLSSFAIILQLLLLWYVN